MINRLPNHSFASFGTIQSGKNLITITSNAFKCFFFFFFFYYYYYYFMHKSQNNYSCFTIYVPSTFEG